MNLVGITITLNEAGLSACFLLSANIKNSESIKNTECHHLEIIFWFFLTFVYKYYII